MNKAIIDSPPGIAFDLDTALKNEVKTLISPEKTQPPSTMAWVCGIPVELVVHGGFKRANKIEIHTTSRTNQSLSQVKERIQSLLLDNHVITSDEYAVEELYKCYGDIVSATRTIDSVSVGLDQVYVGLLESPPPKPTEQIVEDHVETVLGLHPLSESLEEDMRNIREHLTKAGVRSENLDSTSEAHSLVAEIESNEEPIKEMCYHIAEAHEVANDSDSSPNLILNEFSDTIEKAQASIECLDRSLNKVLDSLEAAEADDTPV